MGEGGAALAVLRRPQALLGDTRIRRDSVSLIPREIRGQVRQVVAGLEEILGNDIVGVYLHGSPVLGCFGPRSDIDLLAIVRRPLGKERKRGLLELLLHVSAPYAPSAPRRTMELDVVRSTALRHWRHPAPLEFHFHEAARGRFEAGEPQPWVEGESRDLAAHVTVVKRAGLALLGPPAEDLFPEVPGADYRDAVLYDLDYCRTHIAEEPLYSVLSLARIWATLATGELHSKASAAEWAAPRLPANLRPVLEHGLDLYVGLAHQELWQELPVAEYVAAVMKEVERLG